MSALSDDSILGATLDRRADPPPHETPAEAPSVRGQPIGRYLLLSQLGAGAMGVVFAAYDPELDRKVALKLLKHHGGDVAAARKRLQREAQALARLDHPNVVTVHDVGVHTDRLFVAMEFVDGQTLDAWMESAESAATATGRGPGPGVDRAPRVRPWREVLEVFMQAGRGLAAAHEAGLVHRDFKPENVMLSADGRVRVMDFGLARGDEGGAMSDGDAGAALNGLTRVGSIMGTPAYMSLEQFEAREVDARSDQFGFCVALYEALYGERPFAGDTIPELVEALRAEVFRAAPRRSVVPNWVRSVVLRGLARDPAARFGSMRALLDALAADPVARRRRLLTRAALAVVLGLSVWGVVALSIRLGQRDAVIAEQAGEIDLKNAALAEQLAAQTRLLSVQRGLRAKALIPEAREAEALVLGIQAVGAYASAWDLAPREALEGLEQVLAHDTVVITDEQVLTGHGDYLTEVAYSPDSTRIATTSKDGTARIWDARTGAPLAVLRHDDILFTVVFSPDGSCVATASNDRSVRLWDSATGAALARWDGAAPSMKVRFSPDGRRLAAASLDSTATILDTATGTPVVTLRGHRAGGVRDVAFTSDGALVATAGGDATARIWDARSGKLLTRLAGHTDAINALMFSPDGARLATASVDRDARVWDVATGRLVAVLEGHTEQVLDVRYAPDGARVATSSWDSSARVFDPETGALVCQLVGGHSAGLTGLAYRADGARLVTSSYDGSVVIWDPATGEQVERLVGHAADVWAVAFSPDGRQVATAGVDGTARLWDLGYPRLAARDGPESDARKVVFSPGRARLATTDTTRRAHLWDAENGQRVATLGDGVRGLAFSPDGQYLATLGEREAQVWDATTGAARATVPAPADANQAHFSDDGAYLRLAGPSAGWIVEVATAERVADLDRAALGAEMVVGAPDGARFASINAEPFVRIWDARTGASILDIDLEGARPRRVAWSPDGARLALAVRGAVHVWDAESYALVTTCDQMQGLPRDLTFSPDSARLLVTSNDHGVWTWEPETCRLLARYRPDDQNPKTDRALFSPDGRRIAVTSSRIVRILSGETGEILRDLDGHKNAIVDLWFSSDGARLLTITGPRLLREVGLPQARSTLKIWDVESGELLNRDRIGLVQGDGSIDWPIAPRELTRIGCERLQMYGRAYEQARDLCDSLQDGNMATPQ